MKISNNVFSNIYVITNTFLSSLKSIVFLRSCMKVYINIIVMVNSFIANMNVITYAYRHFPIFIKTYVYIFLVSNSTHAHDNTQSYHQIWKAKNKKKKTSFFNHANLLARIFNSYGDFNIANGELHCFT